MVTAVTQAGACQWRPGGRARPLPQWAQSRLLAASSVRGNVTVTRDRGPDWQRHHTYRLEIQGPRICYMISPAGI